MGCGMAVEVRGREKGSSFGTCSAKPAHDTALSQQLLWLVLTSAQSLSLLLLFSISFFPAISSFPLLTHP